MRSRSRRLEGGTFTAGGVLDGFKTVALVYPDNEVSHVSKYQSLVAHPCTCPAASPSPLRIHKRLIDLHSPADVVKQITSIR